eukprot:TRINITY_DN809_c0_g1_i2.p3 TRINITY_DN809_c0_g1~~TRINITY_DN809_c0_g1_i2.p3  ORF type:complete len:102 (+),score=23.56 TRINITY_DN809_c0_g1_i2:82-387(+)
MIGSSNASMSLGSGLALFLSFAVVAVVVGAFFFVEGALSDVSSDFFARLVEGVFFFVDGAAAAAPSSSASSSAGSATAFRFLVLLALAVFFCSASSEISFQ